MTPVPFSFPVCLHDDGETTHEIIVHGACDRWPTGPGELSWFPTRVTTADGVCSLDLEIINLVPFDELQERVIDTLMWMGSPESAS